MAVLVVACSLGVCTMLWVTPTGAAAPAFLIALCKGGVGAFPHKI